MEILPEGLMLEAETYNALITTMRRDCRVLESFRIMDYSLLVGIHNLDQAAKEQAVSAFYLRKFISCDKEFIQKVPSTPTFQMIDLC